MADVNSLSYLIPTGDKDIAVRETRAATAVTTGWLNRMLGPSLAACRFTAIPAVVEIRRIDWCAAYARRSKQDSAICISSKSVFWTQIELCETVLHEFAHTLVYRWEERTGNDVDGHGPVFFLVLLALFKRVDRADVLSYDLIPRATLYDFADPPAVFAHLDECDWRGLILQWAIEHHDELSLSQVPAEELPELAARRWELLIQRCEKWQADDTGLMRPKGSCGVSARAQTQSRRS